MPGVLPTKEHALEQFSKLTCAIGIYLLLILQPFLAIWLLFKKSPAALFYPYLACAMPGVVLLLLISRLRLREVQGMLPERLARNWGMSGALFAVCTVVAVVYSGVSLGLMDQTNIVGGTTVSVVLSGSVVYAVLHYWHSTASPHESGGRLDKLAPNNGQQLT
ncbi:MAG: hypothetical protein WA869_15535 [Alloacidobacterium sp.]|jgi:hypothetical protein